MGSKMFGEMLRELRLKKGLTLRKFCRLTGLDPGNVSRLERGIEKPSKKPEFIDRIAALLGLDSGTDEYEDFVSAAAISAGYLPRKILSDEDLLERLPIFFRTLDGSKLTDEQFASLVEKIKEES